MAPLRVHVRRLDDRYVAECRVPVVTAVGATPEEAIERARLKAMEAFDAFSFGAYPTTLIARIDDGSRSAIAMQSMHRPFSLKSIGKELGSYYFDSSGNDVSSGW
ncbi:MAG: type II toxin-antitoxin system HicB family antitoxin [Vulcanimicrobiaceae bacterium]